MKYVTGGPLTDWRYWLCMVVAAAGMVVYRHAEGAWWGALGAFALGVAIAQAYLAGRRS